MQLAPLQLGMLSDWDSSSSASNDSSSYNSSSNNVDRITAAHALSLLGNCALEMKTKAALKAFGEAGGGGHSPAGGGAAATVPGLVAPLLRSGVATLAERAAALLGNLCGEPTLRAQLAADARAVGDLVKLLPASAGAGAAAAATAAAAAAAASPAGLGGGLAPRRVKKSDAAAAPAAAVADVELTLSVLAALSNVLVEESARQAAAEAKLTTRLLPLLGVVAPATIPARAASALSRLAREPSAAAVLVSNDGEGGAAAIARFVQARVGGISGQLSLTAGIAAGGTAAAAAAAEAEAAGALEAGVRTLTVLIAAGDAATRTALVGCAAAALMACVDADGATEGVVGNAALAIADLGKEAALLPRLALLHPITPLLKACHRRTGAAQKNAAIACARLAHHPPMLETLKENNGLELIYRYVQP
jgi:hypothetical protein